MHMVLATTLLMTNALCLLPAQDQPNPQPVGDSSTDAQVDAGDGFSADDLDGYVESWVFVSIPEFGTYALREVLDVGSVGWDAFIAFGEPMTSYEPINIFTNNSTMMSTGVMVMMPIVDCLGDFDHDGVVDAGDLMVFAQAYVDGDLAADITSDGNLDIADQLLFFELATLGCVVGQ